MFLEFGGSPHVNATEGFDMSKNEYSVFGPTEVLADFQVRGSDQACLLIRGIVLKDQACLFIRGTVLKDQACLFIRGTVLKDQACLFIRG